MSKQKPLLRKNLRKLFITKNTTAIVIGSALCLILVGEILAQWGSSLNGGRINPASAIPPANISSSNPSKEYIYAGGRLIATEEPTSGGGSSTLSAPASLTATGVSASQVNLNWTASTGGTVDHYQVERCQNFSSDCYAVVASNVTSTTYNDAGISSNAAYIYRVRAVDLQGNLTNYSNIDLATSINFADDPLNPDGSQTIVKAQHLIELRQAINAIRALAGLASASWTYPDPVSDPLSQRRKIYAQDVMDLRTNLDQALSALGFSLQPYVDPILAGVRIKKIHVEELRQRVK